MSDEYTPLVKDESYFVKGIHLAFVSEAVSGKPAWGSHMLMEAIAGLGDLGWGLKRVADLIQEEQWKAGLKKSIHWP